MAVDSRCRAGFMVCGRACHQSGREAMNFSEWPQDDAYKAGKRLTR